VAKAKKPLAAMRRNSAGADSLAARANLGPKSARMLAGVGITSFHQLERLGAVAAYAKVKRAGLGASLNLLWALEGAITETHWRIVAKERRLSLLLALEDHERGHRDHSSAR